MIVLAEPDPSDMVQAITKAIHILPQIDPQDMHIRVGMKLVFLFFRNCISSYFLHSPSCQMKTLYSWPDVARRTEIVYDRALRCSDQPLQERLSRYNSV